MGYTPPSPNGHTIKHVAGTPDTIVARGNDIETLGQQMLDAATMLQQIESSSIADGEQVGKAIEKLQESIGDSWKTLREAGDLYKPVGPFLVAYGEALATYKPKIDASADECERLWAHYDSLPGFGPGDTAFRGRGRRADAPEAGSEEAEAEAAAKEAAYNAWETEADDFDTWYKAWEEAYDDAVQGISEEMSGEIKDGFMEFLEDLVDVLGWIGLVVGIAALIIGGPILAAIAAAVAVIALVATIILAVDGRKSGWDLAFAVLDVVPFGKAGRLLQHGNKLKFFDGHMLNPSTYTKVFKGGEELIGNKTWKDVGVKVLTGKNGSDWGKVWTGNFDMAAFRARPDAHFADNLLEYPIRFGGATLESVMTPAEHFFKLEGYYSKVTGEQSLKEQHPALRIF